MCGWVFGQNNDTYQLPLCRHWWCLFPIWQRCDIYLKYSHWCKYFLDFIYNCLNYRRLIIWPVHLPPIEGLCVKGNCGRVAAVGAVDGHFAPQLYPGHGEDGAGVRAGQREDVLLVVLQQTQRSWEETRSTDEDDVFLRASYENVGVNTQSAVEVIHWIN